MTNLFLGSHTHYLMKSLFTSKLCIRVCSLHCTALQTEESIKSIFSCPYMEIQKSTCDSKRPKDRLVTVKRRKGDYASCSVLSNILQSVLKQKDCMLNTSAITAVIKSSMKSRSNAPQILTYTVVQKGMENKGKL